MGTQFQKVVDGDTQALAVIAQKASIDPAALSSHALVETSRGRYLFRSETLVGGNLRRAAVTVCPQCLARDIAAAPRLQPQLGAIGRSIWQFNVVKTCPVHSIPLIPIAENLDIRMRHDFAYHIGTVASRLGRMAEKAVLRPLTLLERYVVDRLEGARTSSPFLDGLELHAAIRFSETVGAVAIFGRTANLTKLSDDEWRFVGAAGFEIAAGGQGPIEAFLRNLQETYEYSRSGNEGAKSIFGHLYQGFTPRSTGPGYERIRDLVGGYIRQHLPLGPGDEVFGRPIQKRTLHSIRSLSIETGMHPKLLRKVLRAAGTIGIEQDALLDANVVFPVEEVSQAVERAQRSLTLAKAGHYLNAPMNHRNGLVRAGLLTSRGGDGRFAIADLDDLLARLSNGADTVAKPSAGQVDIPEAAKRAYCTGAAIVRLVVDRKLTWVGRLTGTEGYLGVLVNLDEVRELVRGVNHGGLTPAQVAGLLKTGDPVVRALIRLGHIATVATVNPVNRSPQQVVMPSEVKRFGRVFASLYTLAKEQGRHLRTVKKILEAAGLKPAFDPGIGASFYRRSDVASALESNRPKPRQGKYR